MGLEPENTPASFARAIKEKVDIVELDVYITPDQELVVSHDYPTKGKIDQTPRLGQILDLVDARAVVNIELKGIGAARPVARVIESYIKKGWPAKNFLVSSYSMPELAEFKSLMPDIKIAGLYFLTKVRYFAITGRVEPLSYWRRFSLRRLVRQAHANRQEIYVGSINKPGAMKRMQALGVDGIFTDRPDLAKVITD